MALKLPLKISLVNSARLEVSSNKKSNWIIFSFVVSSHFLSFFLLVLVNSGSRHEAKYPSGIAHFLEKLAFSVS